MNPHIQKLLELQSEDLRAAELRHRIGSYPEQLARIDKSLAASREAVTRAKQRVVELQKDRKKRELDADDWRDKIRKYKDQIYQLKSNEAYRAMQEEIRTAEAELARAEDRLLEEMVGAEDAERAVKEAERSLAEAEAGARAEREKLLGEKAAFEKDLAEVEAASQARLAELPGDLVDHYHRIARRHGGIAVAAVRDEACSMCSVRVRPHVMQMLRQSERDQIFHCETCTRILYVDEKPAPAEATSEAPAAGAGS